MKKFSFACTINDTVFVLMFFANWFGRDVKIADVDEKEFVSVYDLIMNRRR